MKIDIHSTQISEARQVSTNATYWQVRKMCETKSDHLLVLGHSKKITPDEADKNSENVQRSGVHICLPREGGEKTNQVLPPTRPA